MKSTLFLLFLALSLPCSANTKAEETAARMEAAKRHWAFKTPTRPQIPSVKDSAWPRNDIDQFILAKLEAEGLRPSPETDRATLLRRLSLDLIGLPPSPEELDAFLQDSSSDAYEKQVERLLKSPHYGERWARHWLDAARYADSDGFEKDKQRQVWFYRDWVINAINRDLPYDQFIVEQLAGDQLPNATQDQKVATGFLRNSMINEEGGIDPEQFRMEAMFDRMDAIGKSMLGLTIQCAQCHDHKFDPISQQDYYKVFAFLNNDHESNITVYTPAEQQVRSGIFDGIRMIEDELKRQTPDWEAQMSQWESALGGEQRDWVVVTPQVDVISDGGQKYLPQADGSFLAQGYAPTKHTVVMTMPSPLEKISGVRLELLNDENLPRGGPGRSIEGTGALTEFTLDYAPADGSGSFKTMKWGQASADVNPPEKPLAAIYDDKEKERRVTGPAQYAIDGKELTAWGFNIGPGRSNQPWKAVFPAAQPVVVGKGAKLKFWIRQDHGGWNSDDNQNHNLGRFRLSLTSAENPQADPVPRRVREILRLAKEKRSPAQVAAVFGYWRTTVPAWKAANEKIEELWKQHPEGSTQLILTSRDQARDTRMLKRGEFLKPMDSVAPGVPSVLHPIDPQAPPTRLSFAHWLTDKKSPTTARAAVNRVWQAYFVNGLLMSPEDFGVRSETPPHPELLDWLAIEFMERGWSLKNLHRLIVNSASYRQSSKVTDEMMSRDPDNRLLARGPRTRVEGEIVRDIALTVSGLLNPAVGGPSVYPPSPAFLYQPPVSYGPKIWNEEKGPNRYRRGLYSFRYRSIPYPMLQNFDVPNGDFSCVKRVRSNTPLQALTTLNEDLFVEAARALGDQVIRQGGESDESRLNYAFKRCLSREPAGEERALMVELRDKQRSHYADKTDEAWKFLGHDKPAPDKLPKGLSLAETAAWTAVSRVLLNLDETMTKE